ncbi:MAG: hypothetical protein KGH53_03535 [Candidatus Micrarchaeota archaeon]|nr:hypothetical protein [Candidatus Micrarchaeota archaeon]
MVREKYVTISAKISTRLRARMRIAGIKPSSVIKEAIENALVHEKLKKLDKEFEVARRILGKIPIEEVVQIIREDRDSR